MQRMAKRFFRIFGFTQNPLSPIHEKPGKTSSGP
jgi:hypothetical protein